jgi:hypothetical protein
MAGQHLQTNIQLYIFWHLSEDESGSLAGEEHPPDVPVPEVAA